MKAKYSASIRFILLSIFFAFILSLSQAKEVSLTILHTTDLHGHISDDELSKEPGGLIRCATLIRAIREREENVLLIDCGDLIQGTAESFLTKGDIMMDAVQMLHYDVLIPGNHEFDWGVKNLRRLYNKINIPIVVANILASDENKLALPNMRPFLIREIDGVRIVIVGLTTPCIPFWSRPRLLDNLKFEKSTSALWRILPHIREVKPDILILAVHQGHKKWGDDIANEINSIARYFQEFDIIIGGHTHQKVIRRNIKGIAYTQAGCYGDWLGKIHLVFDDERHCIISKKFELLSVDKSVQPDPEMIRHFAEPIAKAAAYLNQTVGIAERAHLAKSHLPGQSGIQMLIAGAIHEATGAKVVFHGTLSSAILPRGRIAMRDIWRIVPYENYLGTAHLTLKEIDEILEENSNYLHSNRFRGVFGITYNLCPGAKPGSVVSNIRLANGSALNANQRIQIAFNSYDMASAARHFYSLRRIIEKPTSLLNETDIDTREAVISYIQTHSPLNERISPGAFIISQ